MAKRYRLLKDLPNAKTGTILIQENTSFLINKDDFGKTFTLTKEVVENSPEWFEEVNDRVEVRDLVFQRDSGGCAVYQLKVSSVIPEKILPVIFSMIQEVLNATNFELIVDSHKPFPTPPPLREDVVEDKPIVGTKFYIYGDRSNICHVNTVTDIPNNQYVYLTKYGRLSFKELKAKINSGELTLILPVKSERTYTLQELEEAFNAGRKGKMVGQIMTGEQTKRYDFSTFTDYKNTIL